MTANLRCAIYTRKSTEEGLEQDFNSLHAQREACEAFIKSQSHEGWRALPEIFDDGGYSGGTMERPALTRLLEMVRAGRVDIIVVYKVDRLTRALADFAKMVELLDAHRVSFVSVTQQFNTTSSMGRLTLNVLLSFAQFEREVTAERIRDKIAASKKRGMWMGGTVPLGYDVKDRQLLVNETEAEAVRSIFESYLKVGTVRQLQQELDRLGILTKIRKLPNGRTGGGLPFSRGHLCQLLANPIYIGEIAHKGARYKGQHRAILDLEVWEAVQAQLKRNAVSRRINVNSGVKGSLRGLVYDDTGDLLRPTHTAKKGRRYHYFVSGRLIHDAPRATGGWRIPSRMLEKAVARAMRIFLDDGLRLVSAMGLKELPADRAREALDAASQLAMGLSEREVHRVIPLIRKVSIHLSHIKIDVKVAELVELLVPNASMTPPDDDAIYVLEVPMQLRRRGVETKLVIGQGTADEGMPDPKLIQLVSQCHGWLGDLIEGEVTSIRDISYRAKMAECDVSRFFPLAFLAPDIVEAILSGRQPIELTAERLKRIGGLPLVWEDQRRMLGLRALAKN